MLQEKEIIRKSMIEIRKNLLNKKEKSKNIINKIISLDNYQKALVIALYKSLPSEVEMDDLINYSLKCGKIVLLPKIINKQLEFIEYHDGDELKMGSFHVQEPVNNNICLGKIDMVITPGLAFDKEGHRLGYGKGYYDKFFEKNDTYKLGVCYSEQLIQDVPVNYHDIKMDMVIHD